MQYFIMRGEDSRRRRSFPVGDQTHADALRKLVEAFPSGTGSNPSGVEFSPLFLNLKRELVLHSCGRRKQVKEVLTAAEAHCLNGAL